MNIIDYESLGFSNDFMFGRIMQDESLCKPFLEQILGFKIKKIVYLEKQKVIDEKVDAKSVRFDIYVEDDNTIYECEMQTAGNRNLPKRSRYYQGQIDMNLISKGEDYSKLKKSFVIFICTFDPFGENQYIYTYRNVCKEIPELELNDDTYKIFINTKGTKGAITQEVKELLQYIDTSIIPDGCSNKLIPKLDEALSSARTNKEWRHDYMTLELLKNECRAEGREEGREEGRREGHEEGRRGERVDTIIRLFKLGLPLETIASGAATDITEVREVLEKAGLLLSA